MNDRGFGALAAVTTARTVPALLAARRALHPDAPALLTLAGDTLSYAALAAEVDRHADALAGLGFGRGTRVAVALPNGIPCAIAILAAMEVAPCAPLDPSLGAAHCATILARLRVDALVVAEADASPLAEAAREAGIAVLDFPSAPAAHIARRCGPVRAPVAREAPRPDDLALLMHTSGTTGKPKIVPTNHTALVHIVRVQPTAPGDRFLCVTPLFTRSGLGLGLLSQLANGAATILAPGFDATRFVDWLDDLRPTCYTGSATIQHSVIDAIARRPPRAPHSLRFARASSTALPEALRQEFEALLGVPLVQGYGSTETGSIAQNPLPPAERRAGSVGVALDGVEILIADEDGARLPARGVGEILVRGPGLMVGYEDDPEANRAAFRDGWYRTGDLGYLDADGYLFITGRFKEFINRGGIKVSPSEVDSVFVRHPAVRDAATFGIAHPTLGEDVITAVTLRAPQAATAAELREFALRRLAYRNAPSQVVVVDELPRNPLGKVMRHALAESAPALLAAAYEPPRSDLERRIARLYAEVLGLPRVGAHDHFFLLGGDSLRASQVLVRLAASDGIPVDPSLVFEAPTVAELAATVAALPRRDAATDAPPLVRHPREPIAATASDGAGAKRGER